MHLIMASANLDLFFQGLVSWKGLAGVHGKQMLYSMRMSGNFGLDNTRQ